MPNLQIRELPEDLYDTLKVHAKLEQRSLTQQAIVALREAHELRRTDARDRVIDLLRKSDRHFEFRDDAPERLVADDRRR